MFTVDQIEAAHAKVQSGADFPKYIQEIKALGVRSFTTWVVDSRTDYAGEGGFQTQSAAKYPALSIADASDEATFRRQLKTHQQGETDYFQFCEDCARTGIEKWVVLLDAMTCTYFDKKGRAILVEQIPQ